MSGVYIPDMELPTRCWDCLLNTYGYCMVADEHSDIVLADEPIPEWCPIVPVPPHGRLIDAEAFAKEMKARQESAYEWLREAKDHDTAIRADAVISFLCEVKLTLDTAPTIIEAEEQEANDEQP